MNLTLKGEKRRMNSPEKSSGVTEKGCSAAEKKISVTKNGSGVTVRRKEDGTIIRNSMIMQLKDANCKNCYKCVRACPVKAIRILDDKAEINEKLCVYCGKCYIVCPQNARDLLSDVELVKQMIESGEKVYVSLSSTYAEYFINANFKQMGAAIKKLGAVRVEENTIGTLRVIKEYERVLDEGNMKNVFTTACPASNFLIQKYYPELTKYMAPVDTPVVAHCKLMRKAYGDDIKIVAIGPCIAAQKLASITDKGRLIDAYVNFEELEEWMKEAGVEIDEEDPDTILTSSYRGRYFDEAGGVFRAVRSDFKYSHIQWNTVGINNIMSMLGDVDDSVEGYFVDLTGCKHSCLSGPIMRITGRDNFMGIDHWISLLKESEPDGRINPSELADVDVRRHYGRMDVREKEPSEEEIREILALVGKKKPIHMLDCSGCGYPTCRDKAIAVARGMADPYMCIPYSQEKAEAESNHLFEFMPSGIILTNRNFEVADINPAALKIITESVILSGGGAAEAEAVGGFEKEFYIGKDIRSFMLRDFVEKVRLKETEVVTEIVNCKQLQKTLHLTFFRIPRHDLFTFIFDDRTAEYENRRKANKVKAETVVVAQDVVQKQMRIAQEIASLLGETTAETKIAVNRLKKMLEEDENSWE